MRRIFVAAALTLAALSSPALADGTMVRWDRVEGVVGADVTCRCRSVRSRRRAAGAPQEVAKSFSTLRTGFLSVSVTGISVANHYDNAPLGSPTPTNAGNMIVTVVCDSTERFGPITWADATVFGGAGSLRWQGLLKPTYGLRGQRLRNSYSWYGTSRDRRSWGFMLYGAERSIRQLVVVPDGAATPASATAYLFPP